MHVSEVEIEARDLSPFAALVGPEKVAELRGAAAQLREQMAGRVIWNVNSTATGGGVAEMLRGLLSYVRGMEVDARWLVISGDQDFFHVTKRLHHSLHGSPGDGSPLGETEHNMYDATTSRNAEDLLSLVQPGDVAILHDPQTAGLIEPCTRKGVTAIWRSHIGSDHANEQTELGWAFLRPYLADAAAVIVTREAYLPSGYTIARTGGSLLGRVMGRFFRRGSPRQPNALIIPPSIDPFSAKNQDLSHEAICDILMYAGIIEHHDGEELAPVYTREDGSPARVNHRADVMRLGPPPPADAPLVVQVSRWDPLKDMNGVMRGFAEYLHNAQQSPAHLVLAGPSVKSIVDDPEQPGTMDGLIEEWRELPHGIRGRIHLVNLPMADVEENAVIVNALQRHAAIVVQKSLQEGFGLTVTEAMWKARPVVASRVGGIQDQVKHGDNGRLLNDPRDAAEFAATLADLLSHPEEMDRLGQRARQTVIERYLPTRHLMDYARCLAMVNGHRRNGA